MTIGGLNKFLDAHCPGARGRMPLISQAGHAIAIDVHIWIYANISMVAKELANTTDVLGLGLTINRERMQSRLLNQLISFASRFLSHRVKPIFVCEGKAGVEKAATIARRREAKLKKEAKLTEIRSAINNAVGRGHDMSIRRQGAGRDDMKASIDRVYSVGLGLTPREALMVPSKLVNEYITALMQQSFVTHEDILYVQDCIRKLGLPCLMAKGEGERLCAMLALEGHVSAVYSTDTDVMAYGVPLLITELTPSSDGRMADASYTYYPRIVESLRYTHAEWVELCIMAGCDYNTNIPGIAIIKAKRLIDRYRSIDQLPSQHDTNCLNYLKCRAMFQRVYSGDLIASGAMELSVPTLQANWVALVMAGGRLDDLSALMSAWRSTVPARPTVVIPTLVGMSELHPAISACFSPSHISPPAPFLPTLPTPFLSTPPSCIPLPTPFLSTPPSCIPLPTPFLSTPPSCIPPPTPFLSTPPSHISLPASFFSAISIQK